MYTSSQSSHNTASSVATNRSSRVPVNLLFPQSLTMWFIVWASTPQSYLGSSFKRHLCINWLHWPWPVRIWFILLATWRVLDEVLPSLISLFLKTGIVIWVLDSRLRIHGLVDLYYTQFFQQSSIQCFIFRYVEVQC